MSESINNLNSRDKNTRIGAAKELGGVRTSASLKALINALGKERDKDVKKEIINSLGNLGDPEAVPALRQAERDRALKRDSVAAQRKISSNPRPISSIDDEDAMTSPTYRSEASEDALRIEVKETIKGKIGRKKEDDEAIELVKTGEFKVLNLGEEDRIFDIDLSLENTNDLEDLKDEMLIPELNAQDSWEKSYSVDDTEASELPFSFEEIINTQPDSDEVSEVLVYGHESKVAVTLKFEFSRKLNTLKFDKTLPTGLSEVTVENYTAGTTNIEGGSLIWEINDIEEGTTAECTFIGKIDVKDIEIRPTGKSAITYSGEGQGTTKLVVNKADGYVRARTYVESDERDEQPDNWDNKLIFENRSEFDIELHEVNVSDTDGTYLEIEFSEEERPIIPSGGKWESEVWEKASEEIPLFKKVLRYTVKPEIKAELSGELEVPEIEMAVAYGTGQKRYSANKFASFRKTSVDVLTKVVNAGSVLFGSLTIDDELPEYFQAPESDTIEVWIREMDEDEAERERSKQVAIEVADREVDEEGEEEKEDEVEIKDENLGTQLTAGDYDISIDDADIGEKRKLMCKITREIEPNNCVYLRYSPEVMNPPANITFSTDPIAHAEISNAPELDIKIDDEIGTIQVLHLRRKLTWSKDVLPQTASGAYEITLFFKNRGNIAVQNIKLKDFVPAGFDLTADDSEIQSKSVKKEKGGEIREWEIEKLDEGVEVEITYTLQGSGEYKGKDLLVSY